MCNLIDDSSKIIQLLLQRIFFTACRFQFFHQHANVLLNQRELKCQVCKKGILAHVAFELITLMSLIHFGITLSLEIESVTHNQVK